MKVAVFGTGYWANFQIASWQAIGVEVVAVWNRTRSKADAAAARFGISKVFDSPQEVFEKASFDIADIIADVDAHERLVQMAITYHKPVICQKPMAYTLDACIRMTEQCKSAGIWYAIHENFRYQPPLRAVKDSLNSDAIGKIKRGHVVLKSPDRAIMEKQPTLTTMDHMCLRDMGPHIFDVVRCLFGEVKKIYSIPIQTYDDIHVFDSAISVLEMEGGFPVQCDLVHEWEYRVFIKGDKGTLLLDKDNILHINTEEGIQSIDTKTWSYLPYIPMEDWNIHGGHVFASIPACLEMIKDSYSKGIPAETSGEDNLKTMLTVFAAMKSWDEGRAIRIEEMTK